MKIFISQPMKDKTQEEITLERNEAIDYLKKVYGDDIEIIDSYFEDYNPENGCVPLKFLAKSIEMLADADLAYFIKGWDQTRGCVIENECAVQYGIKVVECY
jgi:hypothetical protein